MSDKIFDLEQQIMQCWHVVDDIDVITTHYIDDPKWEGMSGELADDLMNKYLGLVHVYDLKFDKLFKTFEAVCKEYHTYRKISEEQL